jgi:hypothetical protein
MHATQVATPFHRPGWVYEEKVDGWRMVAINADGRVRLVNLIGIAWLLLALGMLGYFVSLKIEILRQVQRFGLRAMLVPVKHLLPSR